MRRFFWAIPTLLVIITASFFLLRLAPGGPFDSDRALHPQVEANLRAAYHLDQPLTSQYRHYLIDLMHGNFGPSLKFKDYTVMEIIGAAAPVSLTIGALSLLLAMSFGVWFGTYAATRPGTFFDRCLGQGALLAIAVPSFVLAPLLSLAFGAWLGWLPVAGWGNGEVRNLILPVITLAVPYAAIIARLTRSSTREVLLLPHVRTARAKGIPYASVLDQYVMPLAIVPVVNFLGPAAAGVLAGSVVVETMFGLPGLGRYFAHAALNRDYTLVMGIVIFSGTAMIVFNLIADVITGTLDPRTYDASSHNG